MSQNFLYAITVLVFFGWSGISCAGNSATEQQADEEAAPPPEEEAITEWPFENGYYVLNWPDLAIPEYRPEYNEEIEQEVNIPLFREEVKKLDGKMVMIKGFFFPFEDDPDDSYYVLSQFPFAQCFFCGAAGPESVMDLLVKKKPGNIKMDDYVTFKGRFRLNDEDVMYLNYILEDAEWVK